MICGRKKERKKDRSIHRMHCNALHDVNVSVNMSVDVIMNMNIGIPRQQTGPGGYSID